MVKRVIQLLIFLCLVSLAGSAGASTGWSVEKTVSPVSQAAFAGDTVSYEWTVTVSPGFGTVTLDDDQNPGFPLTLTEGGTWTYTEQYTCSADKSLYAGDNTYSFSESNTVVLSAALAVLDSSTATVTVDCYVPVVSKDADGVYDAVHGWQVFKSVNPESQDGFAGEKKDFTWTVTVDKTTAEENILVSGDITVVNPNPEDALSVMLSDELDDGTAATIGPCTGGTWMDPDLTVPAGGTATCDYEVSPMADTAVSNTATAVLNDIQFSALADIMWARNEINPTATLDDDQKAGWPITVSEDTTFTYQDPQGYTCSGDPAAYTNGHYLYSETNTAALEYDTGSDTASATTVVNCYSGGTPAPEFPLAAIPAGMIIGFLGVVLLIRRFGEH